MPQKERPLRILLATPVYWPGTAFGGPIQVFRPLVAGLTACGHVVEIITTSLVSLEEAGARRTTTAELDGALVHRAATPARFRWMGVTPTLPRLLGRYRRPDVVHVFGFRDPVGTIVASWARRNGIPYAFEALGMFAPKLRKVGLKRVLDATAFRNVYRGASLLVAASEREADEYRDAGFRTHRSSCGPTASRRPSGRRPGRAGYGSFSASTPTSRSS